LYFIIFLIFKIRVLFSDFAVMISIILASLLDYYVGTHTQKLTIPDKFQPTSPRSWLVPFYSGKNSVLSILIAIVPGKLNKLFDDK
jgi:hypothetical protein